MTTQNINNVETAGALADADLMLLFRPGQDEEIIKTLASMKAEFAADAAESNILFASASAFVGGEIQLTFGTRLFPSEPDTLLIAFVMPDISSAAATDEVVVTLPLSSSSFRDYTVNDTEVNTLSYSSFETGAVYAMLIRSGGANLIRTDVVSDDSSSDASVGGSILFATAAIYDATENLVELTIGTDVFATRPGGVLVMFTMPDAGTDTTTDSLNLSLPRSATESWNYEFQDSEGNEPSSGNGSLVSGTRYAVLLQNINAHLVKTDLGGSGTGGTLSNEDPEEITVDGDAAAGDSDEGARINHVHPLQNLRGRVPIAYGTATYSGSRMDIVADGYRHDIADTILVVRVPVASTTAVSPTVINVRVGTNPQQSAIGTTGGSGIPGGTFYPGTYYIWMHTNNQYRLLTAGAHADSRWTSETANGAAATITPEQLRAAIATHATGEENVQADWTEMDDTVDSFIRNKPDSTGGEGEENVQSDWTESDNTADSFILNKPDLSAIGEDNVQADWDEADATADAYILNKPVINSDAEQNVQSDWDEADAFADAFILNKPVINADAEENVQSNWDEADNTSDAFILNKPVINADAEENVQSNWDEADNTSDAFILNKPVVSHSPVISRGIAFPTVPAPVNGDQFIFTEDVPSGLDWFDTDATSALTAAEKGDLALYDGTQWSRTLNLLPANAGGFRRVNLYTESMRLAEVADDVFLRLQLTRAPAADSKVEIDIISLSASITGEFPAAEFEADHFLLNEIIPSTQTNTDHMIDETMGRPAPTAGNITKSYTTLFIGRGNTAGDEVVLVCPEWTAFGLMQITIREIKPAGSGPESGLPDLFSAHLEAGASAALSTFARNRMNILESDVIINRGDFTVESGTNGVSAIEVAETGTYLVEFNISVVDDVSTGSGADSRAQVQGDVVVIRAGVALSQFTARTSMYWRSPDDTDEIYISGTHTVDLMANDRIEIHFSTAATEAFNWIIGGSESEISIVRLVGGGGSGSMSGQSSPQAAGTNAPNGLVRERVYQAVASGVGLPIDPPAIWNSADGEFEDDFSPWSRTQPVLAGTEILAVADGFSVLGDQNVRQNGIWAKFFSSSEQYCSIIQDNDTYTLDSTVAGLRFVRSLLTTGWGAWKPIENGTDGWVEIVSAANIHAQDVDSTILRDIPNVDCQWFREIEIEYWPEGTTTGQNPGGKGQYHYRRTSGNWTARYDADADIPELGSFKLRYYDEWGLSGSAALSNSFLDHYAGNISGPNTSSPVRRYSFMVSLIGQNANNPNLITSYQIGPFSGVNKYGKIVVRMR